MSFANFPTLRIQLLIKLLKKDRRTKERKKGEKRVREGEIGGGRKMKR